MQLKDGKIFSGEIAIVNSILPHRNKWAWDLFIKAQANTWTPSEVSMGKDIEQWRSQDALSEDERLLLKRSMGFFAGSESLVANNLLLSIFRFVSDAECRQYILRQAFEESLHNQTVVYICDSLGLDTTEVYEAYKHIPSIKAKDDFLMKITTDLYDPCFCFEIKPSKPGELATENQLIRHEMDCARAVYSQQQVLRNLVTYYIICEGIFFYSGFAMLLSFGRWNKLPGISEQIAYTLRDESLHIQFGTQLIHTIIEQEPDLWDEQFKKDTAEHIRKAADLEIAYAHDVLPRGVLGLNAELFNEYMEFIASRRLESLGLSPLNDKARNPFPWLTESIDLAKQKNFFETRVTEYSTATLVDDMP